MKFNFLFDNTDQIYSPTPINHGFANNLGSSKGHSIRS